MARRAWEKPAGDDFALDIKKAAKQVFEKTEERLSGIVNPDTGMMAIKVPIGQLEDAPWQEATYADIRKKAVKFESMKRAILRSGLLQPIVVWEKENKDGYIILVGHSRKRVYEYLYQDEGLEEYKEIFAFVYPFESLTRTQAIGFVTDSNEKRDDEDEATRIMVDALNLERFDEEAELIYQANRDKYARKRDVLGEMIGKDGKSVSNIKALASLGRETVELLNTTPLRQKDLLNPVIRENEELRKELIENQDKITNDFVKLITAGKNADELKRALHKGVEALEEPDVITITVPNGKGIDLQMEIEVLLINKLNIKRDDFTVKVKKKRKKTAKEAASSSKK